MTKFNIGKIIPILMLVWMSTAHTANKIVQGPFFDVSAIETKLKKGVSTKVDVQQVLGKPQGMGGAVFPVSTVQHDVWYYENIKVDNIVSKQSYITLDMHQKVLLVFFSKGIFDGFLWFNGTIKGDGNQ